jgi:hypothetical protein
MRVVRPRAEIEGFLPRVSWWTLPEVADYPAFYARAHAELSRMMASRFGRAVLNTDVFDAPRPVSSHPTRLSA